MVDMFYGDVDEPDRQKIYPPRTEKRKLEEPRTRPRKERKELVLRLRKWRRQAWHNYPLKSVCPKTWIIDDVDIQKLAKVYPEDIKNAQQIVDILRETEEWQNRWAGDIIEVINGYDMDIESVKDEAKRKIC